MDILYAPWRGSYSLGVHLKEKNDGCIFCIKFKEQQDAERFLLYRGKNCYVILNLYPYNAGHLLIMPYAHAAQLHDLSAETRQELMELVTQSSKIVQDVLKCDGLNLGLNCGKPAGGSIPDHLHFHVLPRWTGDTNFLPALATTKVVSFDLTEIYQKLKPAFDALG